jgi:hypothetical protein
LRFVAHIAVKRNVIAGTVYAFAPQRGEKDDTIAGRARSGGAQAGVGLLHRCRQRSEPG